MQASEIMLYFYKNRTVLVPIGFILVMLLAFADIFHQSAPLRTIYAQSETSLALPATNAIRVENTVHEWPLFGVNESGLGMAASLPWELVGILQASTPAYSSVVVESQKVQTQVYLGGVLPDGSTLESISPTQIVVKKGGKSFVVPLSLEKFTPSSVVPSKGPPQGPGDDEMKRENLRKLWENQFPKS